MQMELRFKAEMVTEIMVFVGTAKMLPTFQQRDEEIDPHQIDPDLDQFDDQFRN